MTSEPFTELHEASVGLHEFFLSLIAAGFTEHQALYLVAQMLTSKANKNDENSGN